MSLQMPTMWLDATSWPFVATQPLQSPQQGRRSLPIITGSEQRGFWLPGSCWPECLSHLLHRSKVYFIYSGCLKPPRRGVDGGEAAMRENSHPRTQTCFPCRCRSPSLWAEERGGGGGGKGRGWDSGSLDEVMQSLACNCKIWLTPFVERATKCFATAALCGKMKETTSMTFKRDKWKTKKLLLWDEAANLRLWRVPGTRLWPTLRWWWSLGWWKSFNDIIRRHLTWMYPKQTKRSIISNCKVPNQHPGEFLLLFK